MTGLGWVEVEDSVLGLFLTCFWNLEVLLYPKHKCGSTVLSADKLLINTALVPLVPPSTDGVHLDFILLLFLS